MREQLENRSRTGFRLNSQTLKVLNKSSEIHIIFGILFISGISFPIPWPPRAPRNWKPWRWSCPWSLQRLSWSIAPYHSPMTLSINYQVSIMYLNQPSQVRLILNNVQYLETCLNQHVQSKSTIPMTDPWCCYIYIYMVLHGSHQYTPNQC